MHPYEDFLTKCKSLLKPGGKIIIATNNRLGIKYFSGAPEYNTGRTFEGILGYPFNSGVKTFSRLELKNLLDSCGLTSQIFYYLYPDYNFPLNICSDDMMPQREMVIRWGNDNEYRRARHELFPDHVALASMMDAGLYREFANAFLVIASPDEIATEDFPTMIYNRSMAIRPEHQISVRFGKTKDGAKTFHKYVHSPAARKHLRTIVENCQILTNIYGREHVAQSKLLSDDVLEMEFIEGERYDEYLLKILKNGGVQPFIDEIKFYYENILRGEDSDYVPETLDYYSPNRQYDMDASFINTFVRNNTFVFVDYEFLLEHLPKKANFYQRMADLHWLNGIELSHYGFFDDKWFCNLFGIKENDKSVAKKFIAVVSGESKKFFERYKKTKFSIQI